MRKQRSIRRMSLKNVQGELYELSRQYPCTYEDVLTNAQDMGIEPHSDAEAREALRQFRGLVDAGEAQ